MKKSLLVLSSALLSLSCTEKQADTVSLFNGRDLSGWTSYMQDSTKKAEQEFTVSDGVISLSGTFGYIRTTIPYTDYKLNAQWCWPDSATNSGIFVHIEKDGIWPNGYECQLWTGRAGDLIHSGGADSEAYRADSTKMILTKFHPSNEKPVGEWNTAEIVCEGDAVTVYINGELQNEITGVSNTQGYIGLQSEGGPILFRDVTLSPIR